MDIMWLEDFIKLADEGNFSRAAEARNLTQPAFSRRIRALEDWVGATLVDRDTHRIALTEAGQAFRILAEEILRRLTLGRDHVREIGGTLSNEIRFASTHALSTTFFPSWLRSLSEGQEAGTITLIADNMVACERFMLEGKADFLLCHHHTAAAHRLDPAGFASLLLGQDVLLPVAAPAEDGSPAHRLPGSGDQPLPYLEFEDKSGMGRILQAAQVISAGSAALRTVFRSHMATALLSMARDGRGLCWAPLSLAGEDLESGRLVAAGDASWHVPIEIRIYKPIARRSPSVEAFWTSLKNRIRSEAA
ncbi:LysR family transcriptional regulator [Sphingopyxis sp. J-6]|uniref:LysR family transcriptional regulator n=1 Tax=Sphingopyxis sp. J-6 TaxID=3122054 RepID=UPI00398419DB